MRILIDECLPRHLKAWLGESHDALTVQELGWANVKNGKLLRAAEDAGFDIFITSDKNMYYQQNFDGLRITAVVIPSNRKLLVQKSVPALRQTLERVQRGQKVVMDLGSDTDAWESLQLDSIENEPQYTTHVFKSPGIR